MRRISLYSCRNVANTKNGNDIIATVEPNGSIFFKLRNNEQAINNREINNKNLNS